MRRLFGDGFKTSLLVIFITIVSLSSCLSPKKVVYFQDVTDSAREDNAKVVTSPHYVDPVILPNDILAITLQTIEQNPTNTPITTQAVGTFNPLNGFLVDKNGNVELSLVGFVHVGGLTTSEAREVIKDKAQEFYKQPVVNVRIANFEVNLLGEVNSPGTYPFPSEKVNIIEAIAAAGDMSMTGKRNNILLVRTEGDNRKFVRFDMRSTDIFRSKYFYLRQRDIVYVEPTRFKVESSDNTITRNIGILSAIFSIFTLFVAIRNFK